MANDPGVLSALSFGVAEVVRLQKSPNSHEFGYPEKSDLTGHENDWVRSGFKPHNQLEG